MYSAAYVHRSLCTALPLTTLLMTALLMTVLWRHRSIAKSLYGGRVLWGRPQGSAVPTVSPADTSSEC